MTSGTSAWRSRPSELRKTRPSGAHEAYVQKVPTLERKAQEAPQGAGPPRARQAAAKAKSKRRDLGGSALGASCRAALELGHWVSGRGRPDGRQGHLCVLWGVVR